MKILLARPRQPADTIGLQHIMIVEPLELEVIAALVKPPGEVLIVDLILEREPLEYFIVREKPDIVGLTGYITSVGVVRDLARRCKAVLPGVRVVVGGPHAEVCPQDFDIPEIDFRVIRNATTTFPRLVEFIRGTEPLPPGVLSSGRPADQSVLPDFDFSYPMPRRDLTARYRKHYFYFYQDRVAIVKTSFGCPFSCSFCFCHVLTRGKYAVREMSDVLDEIERLDEREVYIVDDDFLVSAERVREFIDGLHARGIRKKFQVYGRADFIASHPDLIREFREAGLRVVIVGFESFSDDDLRDYNKRLDADCNIRAMEVLNRNRIDVYATIILHPHWSMADFRRLGSFIERLRIRFANLQPLTPLPGIAYRIAETDLVASRTDWPRWDLAHVTVQPANMSVYDFYSETLRLYHGMIWKPRNLLKNLKYPFHMHFRILKGLARIERQYKRELRDAALHA